MHNQYFFRRYTSHLGSPDSTGLSMDISDDFALLQLQLVQDTMRQTDEEFEEHIIACAGLIIYGLEEARRLRSERRHL